MQNDLPLPARLAEALERVATALRADQWEAAAAVGLNPAQLAVLRHLAARAEPRRVTDLARHLGVSQPSATDSVAALVRKGLAEKTKLPEDARAVGVRPTAAGIDAVTAPTAGAAQAALAALTPPDQATLLTLLLRTIRALQDAGAIPPQRMCVSCRHFRPHAHPDPDRPHHCALVDAAFGAPQLRVDCREHEPAPQAEALAAWRRFDARSPLESNP